MLLLIFHAGNDLYALDVAQVVEIIPRVNLRKANHCPPCVAGLFNYRNRIVPVIDLCQLLHQTASRPFLSTRIIMVNAPIDQDNNLQNGDRYLGLMAERVTETLKISDAALSTPGTRLDQAPPYLDEMIMYEGRMIQRIRLDALLSIPQPYALTTASLNHGNNGNGIYATLGN
jgi:chemotaxis-related protein WspB